MHHLDRCSVFFDHGAADAVEGDEGAVDEVAANECGVEIVDLEGDVGDGLNEGGDGAVGFEAEPLDAEFTGSEARGPDLDAFEEVLAGAGLA